MYMKSCIILDPKGGDTIFSPLTTELFNSHKLDTGANNRFKCKLFPNFLLSCNYGTSKDVYILGPVKSLLF